MGYVALAFGISWRVGARWYAVALLTIPTILLTILLFLSAAVDPAFAPRFQRLELGVRFGRTLAQFGDVRCAALGAFLTAIEYATQDLLETLGDRLVGRHIIVPRRNNSDHLHRPWRAIRKSTPEYAWTAEGSGSALPFDGQAASGT
jgi:hypothetical protein